MEITKYIKNNSKYDYLIQVNCISEIMYAKFKLACEKKLRTPLMDALRHFIQECVNNNSIDNTIIKIKKISNGKKRISVKIHKETWNSFKKICDTNNLKPSWVLKSFMIFVIKA